jgi:MFS family permease
MSQHEEISQSKGQQEEFVESIEAMEAGKPTPAGHIDVGPKQDQALQLIEDAGYSTTLTPENNKRVLRRIDLRLLPILLSIYFLQQLDKSTLSYASVFGLVDKAHLHGKMYSWLGSVVYLAQLIFQPLVSYLLVKVPMGKFMAASVLLWGIALSCMTAANSFTGLLVCRLFLGIFEAGIGKFDLARVRSSLWLTLKHIAPAFIAVTQMWYRRLEQPVRLGSWYAMNGVVNMVSSQWNLE